MCERVCSDAMQDKAEDKKSPPAQRPRVTRKVMYSGILIPNTATTRSLNLIFLNVYIRIDTQSGRSSNNVVAHAQNFELCIDICFHIVIIFDFKT